MNAPSDATLYAMMFLAGCAVPTMAAINATLGARLASPVAAVLVLCSVAALVAAIALALVWAAGWQAWPAPVGGWRAIPGWQLLGGVLFIVYILSATIAVPRIGLGNAIFLVLLGQLATAAAIDHFGLLGAPLAPLSARRAAGLMIMVIGVALARRDAVLPPVG